METEAVVVGGGVVGLSVARALALGGREVVLLEAEPALGQHASSRNSEVIHAGFYYPAGSLKARLCVAGRRALYAYAAERGIPHRRIGKLVVATEEAEEATLEAYAAQGRANGVEGLSLLDSAQARELEPHICCVRALLSAETGIIDSHALLQSLRRDAVGSGATIALRSPVICCRAGDSRIEIAVGGPEASTIRCAAMVNAAGLRAQEVARATEGVPARCIPPSYLARGHYFALRGSSPFRRLVYPIASAGGLGIHVTVDLSGAARFGPDADWIDRIDYSFDESRAPAFEAAIRRYWPGLPDGALQPGYTGIRAKLGPAGTGQHDFVIQGPREHGVPGLVNLFGIESPGLTASLAIADQVVSLLH